MSLKICVYAICKNESAFVDRWIDSMEEADLIVVTDTGSTDATVEKLKKRGVQVHTEEILPWRFDIARNISLEHVPEDADICVCTDLDEVFEKGWRKKLEQAWNPSFTRGKYIFTSEFNEDNTPAKQFIKEKIHRRKGFRWVHPVHEVLEFTGEDEDKSVFIPGIVLNHYPDLKKPRSQYLPLLEISAEENPEDSQTMFWLGREYFFNGKYDLSIEALQKYLKLPTSVWSEEKCAAMCFIASSYDAKGNLSDAKMWLFKAIAECSHVREPFLNAARLGYKHEDWPLTYAMVKSALAITQKSGSYLTQTGAWGYALYDLGAISAYWLGNFEESRNFAFEALRFEPENQRLKNNLQLIDAKIAQLSGKEG